MAAPLWFNRITVSAQGVSLRAKRSNPQGAIALNGGDCFVASLLAMTDPKVVLLIFDLYLNDYGQRIAKGSLVKLDKGVRHDNCPNYQG
jgi:hypothetical protein